jgi:hypothetical protein
MNTQNAIAVKNSFTEKRRIIFTMLVVLSMHVAAQDKQIKVEIEKSGFVNAHSLGENGFVLTREHKGGTADIAYYNSRAELLGEAKVDVKYSGSTTFLPDRNDPLRMAYDFRDNFLVASNTGSVVYQVDMKHDDYYSKPHFITQIGRNGAVKKFRVEASDALGKNLQTAFCDEQYFYYLATDGGNEGRGKKKSSEKLVLNRFDAKDFSGKRFVLDLPAIADDDHHIFWTYAGQTATEKFLVSKNLDPDNGKAIFTLAAFNADGKVTRTFVIDLKLEGKYIRPAYQVKSPVTNFYQCANLDYRITQPGGASYTVTEPTNGGFSHIVFDAASGSFFVFGLTGPKPFKKGAEYDGFYIYRYDTQGALQWKLQQAASKELTDEKYFRTQAFPGYRNICLQVLPNDIINFSIQFKKTLFSHAITAGGKVTRTIRRDDSMSMTDNRVNSPGPKLKSDDYLDKLDPKKKDRLFYSQSVSSQGELLFELTPGELLTIFYFKPS